MSEGYLDSWKCSEVIEMLRLAWEPLAALSPDPLCLIDFYELYRILNVSVGGSARVTTPPPHLFALGGSEECSLERDVSYRVWMVDALVPMPT